MVVEAEMTFEILIAARDLIADPARWTRASFARNIEGKPVSAKSKTAVCWCAMGALKRVCPPERFVCTDGWLYRAGVELFDKQDVAVNDELGHAAVMQMYAKAIADAQAEEARA